MMSFIGAKVVIFGGMCKTWRIFQKNFLTKMYYIQNFALYLQRGAIRECCTTKQIDK